MHIWVCGGEEGGERTRVSEKEWTQSGHSTWLCSTQKDRIQWAELRFILTGLMSPTLPTGWCRNVHRSHGTGEARKERGTEGRWRGTRSTLGENAKRKDRSILYLVGYICPFRFSGESAGEGELLWKACVAEERDQRASAVGGCVVLTCSYLTLPVLSDFVK